MQLLLNDIRQLITEARRQVNRHVNTTMVMTYWHIGKRIVDDEQQGKKRAQYATEMFKHLSANLTLEFGKGFSETNLKQMRQFYTKPKVVFGLKIWHLTYPLSIFASLGVRFTKFLKFSKSNKHTKTENHFRFSILNVLNSSVGN